MQPIWTVMVRYFAEEKLESAVFVAIGAAAIALAVLFLVNGSSFRGMAFPLIVIGLIQIGVGGSVYLRTDGQVAELREQLAKEPDTFRAHETERMQAVARNFKLYKLIEIALLAVGIGLSFLGPRRELLYGIAMGLIAQAAIMLVLDLLAEQRAAGYLEALERFETSAPI